MKYLKKFANHSAYNSAKDGLALPNVSHCVQENDVHYNPAPDPCQQHDWVYIGGKRWATKNIGACTESDFGNYYQYGKGARQYTATSGDSVYDGAENPLAASADTATQVWGDDWRMPTKDEFLTLIENTDYEWTSINGVYGGKFKAKRGSNYVFFPAAGQYINGALKGVGNFGMFYNSTPHNNNGAYYFNFSDGYKSAQNYDSRTYGNTVRAIFIGDIDDDDD